MKQLPESSNTNDMYRAVGSLGRQTIPEYFSEVVRTYGKSTAIIGKSHYSYNRLWKEVLRIAGGLQASGVTAGEPIVLQMPNDENFITVFLATLVAGAVPVLALPAHRESELHHFVQVTQAHTLILSMHQGAFDCKPMIDKLMHDNPSINRLFTLGTHERGIALMDISAQEIRLPRTQPDDTAFFLLSGGTTGLPKLIPRRHAEYIYNCNISAKNAEMDIHSRYLAVLPMSHNFGLGCPGIFGTLFAGGTIVIGTDTSPGSNFALIQSHRVTHSALVPALAFLWAEARAMFVGDLSSLQVLQVGGSRTSPEIAKKLVRAFPNCLQQSYGMGEGLLSQTHRKDDLDTLLNTQGRPLSPYDEIRIVDSEGRIICERPGRGELQVKGPYTIDGYYNADKHNAAVFTPDGYFCTGDIARINDNGTLIIEGRINDVINRGGDKIAPDEIEDHLLHHPDIKEAAVVSLDDEVMGQRVCAVLLARAKLRLIDVIYYLRGRGIADYKLPDKLVLMEDFPKTPFGKVDRKQIRYMVNR